MSKDADTGGAPLHIAAAWNQFKMVELLLDHGAEVRAKDRVDAEPLDRALYHRDALPLIELLSARGAHTTLFVAIAKGDFDEVESIVKADSKVLQSRLRFYTEVSFSPLHFAAARRPADLALNMGHRIAYRRLVEAGAPVDRKLLEQVGDEDRAQLMPRLHQALVDGDRKTVEALLDEDPSLVNTRLPDVWVTGGTHGAGALHWAAMFGHLQIAELLIDRGADLELRDETYGGTPIGWAWEYDRTEMEEFLSGKGGYARREWFDTCSRRTGIGPSSPVRASAAAVLSRLPRGGRRASCRLGFGSTRSRL